MEDYFEPAIHIRHNDNNSSLLLKYVDHSSNAIGNGVSETVITLKDDKYPVTVKLHAMWLTAKRTLSVRLLKSAMKIRSL